MEVNHGKMRRNLVYKLRAEATCVSSTIVDCAITRIQPLAEIDASTWLALKGLQGRWSAFYLKLRYGSKKTQLLTVRQGGRLVHVEWIVPFDRIRARYPFVSADSYSVISCVTADDFRGKGIYPSSLRKIASSSIASEYFIWAQEDNVASLKGIRKAGGIRVGQFAQRKRAFGIISSLAYSADDDQERVTKI